MSARSRSVAVVAMAVLALVAVACGGRPPAGGGDGPATSTPPPERTAAPDASEAPAVGRAARTPTSSVARSQLRGVWVHLFDDTLKSRAGIERMLNAVAAANFNTVIVEVARRQDSYYRSDVLPRTTDPALSADLDILAELLPRAHERGLKVHAWFPAMPTYHQQYDGLPRPRGWVWNAHGPQAPVEQRWVTRSADGRWSTYLDPGHPAVQDHLVAVAAELAARYPIDAVHLDYVRYDGPEWGYNPAAIARFHADTGRSDLPASADAQWSDWRRAQTRAIVERIREAVRAVRPSVGVSAAVIAWGEGPHNGRPFSATRAYTDTLQDWPGWVRAGLIDAVFPMLYFRDEQHGAWYEQWLGFLRGLAAETDVVVAPGQGAYLNPVEASERQLAVGVDGTDGAVVYSYQQSADTQPHRALLDALPRGLFRVRAPAPPLR